MATRFITAACMVGLSVFGVSAQSGSWKGELNVGGTTLPVVFNFSAEGCTLDSPAQGAKGIPAKWTPDASGKVSIQIPVINGSFEGKLTGDSIPGKFTQHDINSIDAPTGRSKAKPPSDTQTTISIHHRGGIVQKWRCRP